MPALWPSATGSPRLRAQRPLPSMMIATDCARSGRSCSSSGGRVVQSERMRVSRFTAEAPHTSMISASLRFKSSSILWVCSSVSFWTWSSARCSSSTPTCAGIDQLLQVVHDVAAHVADGDATFLGQVPDDLDELLAPLLGQLRDRQADDLAVVRGLQPEIRLHDRLLDALEGRGIEGLHRQQPRLGGVDRGQLVERCLLAVVVDLDAVEKCRRGASRAHTVELLLCRLHGLVHAADRVGYELVDHRLAPVF